MIHPIGAIALAGSYLLAFEVDTVSSDSGDATEQPEMAFFDGNQGIERFPRRKDSGGGAEDHSLPY